MDCMNQEDSFANRRRLFKSIWDTAMNIDDKDPDIMKKPKIIKTLRLDEVDRCVIGKTKKQRIKNLRTVCKKILDFCDKQDADDIFYEHLVNESQNRELQHNKVDLPPKKIKRLKIKEALSLFGPITETIPKKPTKVPRNFSPAHSKKNTAITINNNMSIKPQTSRSTVEANTSGMSGDDQKRRKLYRKRIIVKRKKLQPNVVVPPSTGVIRSKI